KPAATGTPNPAPTRPPWTAHSALPGGLCSAAATAKNPPTAPPTPPATEAGQSPKPRIAAPKSAPTTAAMMAPLGPCTAPQANIPTMTTVASPAITAITAPVTLRLIRPSMDGSRAGGVVSGCVAAILPPSAKAKDEAKAEPPGFDNPSRAQILLRGDSRVCNASQQNARRFAV